MPTISGSELNSRFQMALLRMATGGWPGTSSEQCVLVDALVTADWLLRRLCKIEPQLWEIGFQEALEWQRFHKKVMLGDAFTRSHRVFDRLQRRLVSADRVLSPGSRRPARPPSRLFRPPTRLPPLPRNP
ncbi:MAG TPA: hypothetical protein VMH81_05400 [Bryobacteraceae bacterium]|nr:hypothetical protein [Bryobacteraceae bacterium]